MRIVVTGALGHIGSKLIRLIPSEFINSEIVLIDNFSTQRYNSMFNLPKSGRYKLIEGDLRNLELEGIVRKSDVVIHLAAITDATTSFENRKNVESNNLESTRLVSNVCSRVGAKLIHVSSTSVYGTSNDSVDEDIPFTELKPQSPYATTKLAEENYILDKCNKNELKAVSLRFGTIFGISPGIRFHTAVNKFCWQARWGIPLTIWKTAYDQVRPYLDLNDACKAISHVISNDLYTGEVYNVLTMNTTVRCIVKEIETHISDLKINFVETEIMNQLSYEVRSSKFENTGFRSEGSLATGIKETLELLSSST